MMFIWALLVGDFFFGNHEFIFFDCSGTVTGSACCEFGCYDFFLPGKAFAWFSSFRLR